MNQLLAYHNDPALKAELVKKAKAHRAADRYLRGKYWSKDERKGCAVGCTLQSLKVHPTNRGNHDLYESLIGVPAPLAYLEDRIFEGCSIERHQEWPVQFLEAIPVGADLSQVTDRLMYWMLGELPGWEKLKPKKNFKQIEAIGEVHKLYGRKLAGEIISADEWSNAKHAATCAGHAATCAGHAATCAGHAVAAAVAVGGGDVAIADAAFDLIADKLLELLAAAPVPVNQAITV